MHKLFFLASLILWALSLNAQPNLLQAGPMLGYSDYREVLGWVQTTEAAEVKIEYVNSLQES